MGRALQPRGGGQRQGIAMAGRIDDLESELSSRMDERRRSMSITRRGEEKKRDREREKLIKVEKYDSARSLRYNATSHCGWTALLFALFQRRSRASVDLPSTKANLARGDAESA